MFTRPDTKDCFINNDIGTKTEKNNLKNDFYPHWEFLGDKYL